MINIKVNKDAYNRMINTLQKLSEKIQDMTPIWTQFIDYWQNEIMPASLSTKGNIMGERWKPYTKQYLRWKQKHFSGRPMLVLSGKLADAMYGGDGWEDIKTKNNLKMSIDLNYAGYVQKIRPFFSKRNKQLPARAIKYLIESIKDAIKEVTHE